MPSAVKITAPVIETTWQTPAVRDTNDTCPLPALTVACRTGPVAGRVYVVRYEFESIEIVRLTLVMPNETEGDTADK